MRKRLFGEPEYVPPAIDVGTAPGASLPSPPDGFTRAPDGTYVPDPDLFRGPAVPAELMAASRAAVGRFREAERAVKIAQRDIASRKSAIVSAEGEIKGAQREGVSYDGAKPIREKLERARHELAVAEGKLAPVVLAAREAAERANLVESEIETELSRQWVSEMARCENAVEAARRRWEMLSAAYSEVARTPQQRTPEYGRGLPRLPDDPPPGPGSPIVSQYPYLGSGA